ncbi:tail fiber protein [Brenneria sp. 4F2]|nr:tail fiber protein [Brenneria bubanii]
MIQGEYGAILRNDGGSFYLLLTNKGDSAGSWNTLRPLRIDLANGNVELGHDVSVSGNLTEKGLRVYSPNNKPTAADVGAISVSELAGIPLPWPLASVPTGWLKCNGQAFDKATYPKLAAAYPTGKLPDLRGEFIRGVDDGRGVDTGRTLLSVQSAFAPAIPASGWGTSGVVPGTNSPITAGHLIVGSGKNEISETLGCVPQ